MGMLDKHLLRINANGVYCKFFGMHVISLLHQNKKQFAHWWDSKQVS